MARIRRLRLAFQRVEEVEFVASFIALGRDELGGEKGTEEAPVVGEGMAAIEVGEGSSSSWKSIGKSYNGQYRG